MQKLLIFILLAISSKIFSLHLSKFELPDDHFLQKPLAELFHDPSILTSRENLTNAGFDLYKRRPRGLVVASHPTIPGYLIKLFINDLPHSEQVENYVRRIEGARKVQEFINKKHLKHIEVPDKWLYHLKPNDLGLEYLLIVQEIDILDAFDSTQCYEKIDTDVLKEFCLVIKNFRGLDSIVKNMPFTSHGKIAFIDTEHWASYREPFLRYIEPLLDEKRLNIVKRYEPSKWFLPVEHPLSERLQTIFTSAHIFDSPESLTQAGFKVHPRVHKNMMVFTHPDIKNYIFKKFQNQVESDYQIKKYITRLEGAKKIRDFIHSRHLQHIVCPRKWLYKLPFLENDYLIIAEKFDICSGDDRKDSENVHRYKTMSVGTLSELCTIMLYLKGCDAWPRNQPFTKDGKIAFIDTEHVGQKPEHFFRHIMPLLPLEHQVYVQKFFKYAKT